MNFYKFFAAVVVFGLLLGMSDASVLAQGQGKSQRGGKVLGESEGALERMLDKQGESKDAFREKREDLIQRREEQRDAVRQRFEEPGEDTLEKPDTPSDPGQEMDREKRSAAKKKKGRGKKGRRR